MHTKQADPPAEAARAKTALTLERAMPKKVQPSSAFGERLMELRRERNLTQGQLAELIGSTQRAISHYETVAEFPPAGVIITIAQALDVTTDELLGLKPPKKQQPKEDPEVKRLWKSFQLVAALPEKDRRAVVRLVHSLVSAKQLKSPSAKKAG